MSDRIRQLEDALSILQTSPGEQHPLLHRDLLDIKSIIDLHAAVDEEAVGRSKHEVDDDSQYIESFGTLAIRDDGAATFYGPSAGSEVSIAFQLYLQRLIASQYFQSLLIVRYEVPVNDTTRLIMCCRESLP